MASQPNPLQPLLPYEDEIDREPPLSAEEGWDLLFSLFGSAKELYAKYGGGEAFLRAERASWGEDEED